MILHQIDLNLSSRILINRMLGNLHKSDTETARRVRGIREHFELREARRERDRMEDKLETDWLKMVEKAKKENKPEPQSPEIVTWDDLAEKPLKTFTIDKSYLSWLREELDGYTWHEIRVQDPQTGEVKMVDLPLSIAQLAGIADLADALSEAKPVPEEGVGTQKKKEKDDG